MNLAPRPLEIRLRNQSQNCGYSATTFIIWLRWLRRWRWLSTVVPVVLGATATWTIVAHSMPVVAATCAFLATVIPLAYKAARVDDFIQTYTHAAGELTNLRDDFSYAADRATAGEDLGDADALIKRLEAIRALALTPPEFCFWLADLKHKKGHYINGPDDG